MAVKFTDGFDLYTTLQDMDDTRQWFLENSQGFISVATTAGKYGGGALALGDGNTDRVWTNFGSNLSANNLVCVSFLFRTAAATKPSSAVEFFAFTTQVDDTISIDGNNPRLSIAADGRVRAITQGFSTAAYVRPVVDINVCDGLWHHIEWAHSVNTSGGVDRLYVDGVAALTNQTSADTDQSLGDDSSKDRIMFQTSGSINTTYYIDDILVFDDVSSGIAGDLTYTSNFPLGEVRIETIQPNGVGTNSDWTPTSGDNYTNVDEDVADDDTTTVESGLATDLDTYAFSNLAGTPTTIYGVHIGSVGKASPGATTDIRHYTLSSGTADESVDIELNNAYQFNQTWVGQDPNTTAAWTESGVNAAEFGIEKQ